MNPGRRLFLLIILATFMLAISIAVYVRHKSLDDSLLASIGILGAVAILIVEYPDANGKNKNGVQKPE